jgi:hypothetical protein
VGMSTLRKALHLILFAAFVALPLAAQLTDCAFTRTFTGDLNAASSSNISGNTPCVNWRITFSVSPPPDNLTSTVTFQTSPDNANWTSVPDTICSATVQPPCLLQGHNPLTGTAQGMSLFSAYGSYVRVITSGSAGTGTGTIRGYGSKGATASNSGIGGGGSGPVIPSTTNLLAGDGAGGVSDGGVTPTTSVGTPGVDTKVPTEKAVRTALTALLTFQATDPVGACTVGGPNIQNTVEGTQFACVGPAGPGNGTWTLIIGAAINGSLIYYFTNTASGIATYLQATAAPFSPKTTLSFTALATGTDTLQNWATNAGIPNLAFIPAGIFIQHIHALRTGGGTVTLHTQFWEVDAAGVDIAMIGQTEDTPALLAGEAQYDLELATTNVYIMTSSASRLVARVFAVVSGSAPTVQIFVGGTADTHISLPSNTVDATNFVPYTGATADVNLASHGLATANGVTFNGSTGSAKIQPASAQGTPNPIQPPTATGAPGTFLQTDGGNPQQTVWVAAGGSVSAYPTVTDGSPIAWDLGSAVVTNGIVTLIHTTATRALNISNPVNGGFYTLVIKQDATGGALMTLGTGCTWKVANNGAGVIVLTAAANGVDMLTFTYDGTFCWTNYQSNFN